MFKKSKIKTIALTGSRMSGKNRISKMFGTMFDIPAFDADTAFKFIIHYDEDVRSEIKRVFGANSFLGDNLNTAFFDTNKKIKTVLKISEARVFETFYKWKRKQKSNYVIFMFAGLFELTINMENFHSIINVFAPIKIREDRISKDLGEDMDEILENEFPAIKKNVKADYIIHNYDDLNLSRQINVVHKKILKNIS